MAASYPTGFDTMSDPAANLSGPPLHSTMHNQINDVIEAIEAELGLNPSGPFATVQARLDLGYDTVLAAARSINAAGKAYYSTDTHEFTIYDGTADRPPWNLPWGYIGSAAGGNLQTGITAVTDVTGASVTFTAVANRLYKVTVQTMVGSTVATDSINVQVTNSANTIQTGGYFQTGRGEQQTVQFSTNPLSPSAGSATYKVRVARLAGTGTISVFGTTTATLIIVEDIGPSGNPA